MIRKNVTTLLLKGMVIYPRIEVTFDAGRDFSIAAVKAACDGNGKVFLVTQNNYRDNGLTEDDVYKTGVYAEITRVKRFKGDNTIAVTVNPGYRAKMLNLSKSDNGYYVSDIQTLAEEPCSDDEKLALKNILENETNQFLMDNIRFNSDCIPPEMISPENISEYADFVAFTIFRDVADKISILEEINLEKRVIKVVEKIKEIGRIIDIERDIEAKVQQAADKNQEEFYLREKLSIINSKLESTKGGSPIPMDETEELVHKIENLRLDDKNKEMLLRECKKLRTIQPGSPDANVIQTYIEEVLSVPWGKYSDEHKPVSEVESILNEDHDGLEKVKERFVELAAVQKYTDNTGAQIICLVGPPGVGKTSIVSSAAKAMGREYVRLSLGGVHDEAEIRGHRKTYIGAMPGRIASALKQAGVMNPVILLDEIDKLANDGRGDPSAAMLEVLDPAQNSTFRDNYIGIPIDLSKVIFVTTANDPSRIPNPLYDRMEIIELGGYTFEEKVSIAKNHLIKKQRKLHNLTLSKFKVQDEALKYLINHYTKEAGVRRLEQLIAAMCRKALVELDFGSVRSVTVNVKRIKSYFGPEKFKDDELEKEDISGVVNGLAWTAAGGEMLQIEAITMPGTGKTEITGNLGDVMKESARAAVSYIRANADKYHIPAEMFEKKDIHIHVPQGAVPKDGPSAGVTISTAILSALTGRTFKHDVAMTGEISLTGRVMPIGGLKEKSMAAYKNGIKTVIIPFDNQSDLQEVHDTVLDNVKFIPVKKLDEVFKYSLN